MNPITQNDVLQALTPVHYNGKSIVGSGLVSAINVREGKLSLVLTVNPALRKENVQLEKESEAAVKKLAGVNEAHIVLTAEKQEPMKRAVWNREPIADVKRVIAVASGKGGVGKSTTTINLAHAFFASGKRVGILDADIYGPSVPRMMGAMRKPDIQNNKIIPLEAHGITFMSMGLMVGEDSAIVWRAPQATKALVQMLRDVAWAPSDAPLDVLLIDMPPGTGDVHLSLVQQAPIDGAVIVTTPQEIALADARKAIDMFKKVNVPILGIIENMSGFVDSAGRMNRIFGEGGGAKLAEEAQAPFLGEVPIDIALREASDVGTRYADEGRIYQKLVEQL